MVLVLRALDIAAMEGPEELLSGKLQLCFTPAAGTSLLMFRLNDAVLRALQECRRQQVRRTRGPVFPSLSPSGSQASAGDPGEATWGWEEASTGSDLPTSPSELGGAGPPTPPRAPDAGSWECHFTGVQLASALPAGSASDRFPRQPRGKYGPRVFGKRRGAGRTEVGSGKVQSGWGG